MMRQKRKSKSQEHEKGIEKCLQLIRSIIVMIGILNISVIVARALIEMLSG
jgi:uncharacterized protein YggT (Ycf19 family)